MADASIDDPESDGDSIAENPGQNPYAVPRAVLDGDARTDCDRFILEQVGPLLEPKERIRYTVLLAEQGPLWKVVLPLVLVGMATGVLVSVGGMALGIHLPAGAVGGVIGACTVPMLMARTKPFLAAVTSRRLVMVQTKMGAFGPKQENLGVQSLRWKDIARTEVGGFARNRSVTFVLNDETRRVLRLSPTSHLVSGQSEFWEFVQNYDPASLRRSSRTPR